MKKQSLTAFIIVSISALIIIPVSISLGCAYELTDSDVVSFYSPEIIQSEVYKPFFRSINTYYSIETKNDNINDFDKVNTEDWYKYFNKKAIKDDISQLLYKKSYEEVNQILNYVNNSKTDIPKYLKTNSIIYQPDKIKVKDFLSYLLFAKNCEVFSANRKYFWYGEEEKKKDYKKKQLPQINELIVEANKNINLNHDREIKQRYLFQLQRLFFFKGDYNASLGLYNKNESQFIENSSIKFRAMSYAAGALKRLNRIGEANYLFSIVYDKFDPLKITTCLDFNPIDEKDWMYCLTQAKTDREKTVIWHLLGIKYDQLRAMKEIYAIDPSSNLLDLLLVRAINIQEETVLPDFKMNLVFDFKIKSDKINKDLYQFVESTADANNTHRPFIWNISAAYLAILSKDFTKGENYLKLAENETGNDSLLYNQVKLISIIGKIEQTKNLDKSKENEIVDDLIWLKNKHNTDLRNDRAFDWVKKRLSEQFLVQNDSVKSHCLDVTEDLSFYESNFNINGLIALINKPAKTKFEKFILGEYPFNKTNLIELQATKLIYQNKFEEALSKFKEDENSGNRALSYNPFASNTIDNSNSFDLQPTEMTKKTFVEQCLEIQNKLKSKLSDSEAANYYIKLANALYNITYFGNCRRMYQTTVISYGLYYFDYKPNEISSFIGYQNGNIYKKNSEALPDYHDRYQMKYEDINKISFIFNCVKALSYYEKAMSLTKDKETKALCCFMAAKCEQNKFFMNKPQDIKDDFKSGKFFRLLRDKYSDTEKYSEVLNECGYFKKFIESN